MKYTVYNPTNGKIIKLVVEPNFDKFISTLGTNQYVEQHWPDDKYYIVDGQPKLKPADPSSQTLQYDWDADNKQWTLNTMFSSVKSRQYRDHLLSQIDRINPIWYASLTAQQQQQLQAYRQALLNVPQQPGFPATTEWPAKPQWL